MYDTKNYMDCGYLMHYLEFELIFLMHRSETKKTNLVNENGDIVSEPSSNPTAKSTQNHIIILLYSEM